ncbi:unnamed protein product, partial [Meganyctiphanes norvegica]
HLLPLHGSRVFASYQRATPPSIPVPPCELPGGGDIAPPKIVSVVRKKRGDVIHPKSPEESNRCRRFLSLKPFDQRRPSLPNHLYRRLNSWCLCGQGKGAPMSQHK